MASRVNVRFVIILSVVLTAVAVGVGGLFFFVQMRSGSNYARKGDAALARGDIAAADKFYDRAVGKERTNVEWLTKWRDTRAKVIPESYSDYQEKFRMYSGILRSLALVQRTNLDAHKDYLQAIFNANAFHVVADEADVALRFFEPERPPAICRFRGMALTFLYASGYQFSEQDRKKITTAREDLEAALRADPGDAQVAESLSTWHRTAAEKAREADDAAAAAEHLLAAHKVLDDLLALKPGDPYALVVKLASDLYDAENTRPPGSDKTPGELARIRAAATTALKPQLADVSAKLMAADPKLLTPVIVGRFQTDAPRVDAEQGPAMAAAVVERALTADPQNADLLAIRGEITASRGDLEATIAQFQQIIDLPDKPVSLAGLRLFELRNRARFGRANAALALALRAEGDARKPTIDRAREFRQVLAANIPEQSPELRFVDGKLRFVDGDLRGAMGLLVDFTRSPGDLNHLVPEARLFIAEAATKLGEPGTALEQLRAVHTAMPRSLDVLLSLAALENALQDRAKAIDHYKAALDIDPDNETARRELRTFEAIADGTTRLDDPIAQRIAEAQRIAVGRPGVLGDDLKAIEWLEQGLQQHNHDPRLVFPIAQGKIARSDRAGALAVVQAALEKHPGDAQLTDLATRLKASETLEGTLALIDEGTGPAVDKWLAKRLAYLIHNKPEDAAKAQAEAARAAPDDPRVVELQFLDALARKDPAEASRLADRAVALDADRAGGDTFRARLQLADGKLAEAASTLQKAADRGNANASVFRLLGSVQYQLGRGPDAIISFRRALELNPTDITSIKTLMEALTQLDRQQEALGVARASEAFGRQDSAFMNAWLNLEAAAGNVEFALTNREQLLRTKPEDKANAAALADLLITRRAWQQARSLLDSLRAKEDTLTLAAIDARWHADQGNIDRAGQVFVSYIGSLGSQNTSPDPYLVFAQFMLARNQVQTGLAALRQAARFQDPKTMAVDARIADVQLSLGLFGDAEQSFRKLIAANIPDPTGRTRKSLIECLLQQGKHAEAEAEFVSLGAAADADAELMVQRALAARGTGNRKLAREILDRAVAKFPSEPSPYLHRARLVMSDPAMMSDAQADLATALRLRPGLWQALRVRARIYLAAGRADDAVRDYRTAVDANPRLDDLRFEFIDLLLDQGQESDAVIVADAGIKARPSDSTLIARTADRFARRGHWARATRFYKQLWEQLGNQAAAMTYVGALLSSTPPGLAEAEAVLQTPSLDTDKSPELLMARAGLRKKQGRTDQASADALAAAALVTDVQGLGRWHDRLGRVFTEPRAAIAVLSAAKPPASLQDWLEYFRAVTLIRDPATAGQGIAAFQGLLSPGKPKELQVTVAQALSMTFSTEAKYEQAVEVIRTALGVAPDDPTLNNNAAYFLTTYLNRASDALPFAEKAVRLDPANDAVIDTLAATYWALGRKPEAIQKLAEALRAARADVDTAKYWVKLAGWKLQSGDAAGAAAAADAVRELIADNPAILPRIKTEWEALQKDLPAPR